MRADCKFYQTFPRGRPDLRDISVDESLLLEIFYCFVVFFLPRAAFLSERMRH